MRSKWNKIKSPNQYSKQVKITSFSKDYSCGKKLKTYNFGATTTTGQLKSIINFVCVNGN